MELLGLEIDIAGKRKFIGKVGIVPASATIPKLKGHCIIYREAKWRDVISHTTNTFGFDYSVWLRAKELGAEGMVTFCPDYSRMILCSKELIDSAGFELQLGHEGVQVRIPMAKIKVIEKAKPIRMGYTTNCELVPLVAEPQTIKPLESKQAELF